jgi:hypothetical protein
MVAQIPYTGLKEGEKVLWYGRRSLIAYLGRIIVALALLTITIVPKIGFIFLLLGLLLIVSAIISARSHIYYVTTIRIIEERRLFGRVVKETTLDKITDIVFNKASLVG